MPKGTALRGVGSGSEGNVAMFWATLSGVGLPDAASLVQTGQTEGDLIEIKNGVAADEQVATSNLEMLSDGMAVKQ